MLKNRITATLVVKNGIVVQSLGFSRYLPVGKPSIAVEYLDDWGVDEIILLDIGATHNDAPPDHDMVHDTSIRCHVPLTVGGGITKIEHIQKLMHSGADKVSLNQAAITQPELISNAARLFGAQSIIASIDAIRVNNDYRVYDYRAKSTLSDSPAEFAIKLEDLGAGEILINSVDRDGAQNGFELKLIDSVCSAVTVPVICCGGAGSPQHFIEVFEQTQVNAASAANFFHFTEHSVTTTKALVRRNIPIRHETHADYDESCFDDRGRILRKSENVLEELLYQQIEKEII